LVTTTIKQVEVEGDRLSSAVTNFTEASPNDEVLAEIRRVVDHALEEVEDMDIALEVRAREAASDEVSLTEFLDLVGRNPDGSRRA
jgi:hypothetical protein